MNVVMNVSGQVSSLLNQVMATDNTLKAYRVQTSVPTYVKSTLFKGGLTLICNSRTLTSIASATGTSLAGQRTAHAQASIGSLAVTLKNGSVTLMTLTSTRPVSQANFVTTEAGGRTPSGGISITGLTINSAAFGAKNVKFQGTPKANTVVFRNADRSVVIFANRQTIKRFPSGKPFSITVDAISVQLTKFKTGGKTITGNIEIGTSIAS